MSHTVIFVHGFGVMKDARGMFSVISDALSKKDIQCVLLDLNTKDEYGNIVVNTFSEQARILRESFLQNQADTVDVIAHSQGCIVTALAGISPVRKVLFLAPPIESGYTKTIEYFKKNPQTEINLDGISKLARRDGTFTIVQSDYWKEREYLDLRVLYKDFVVHNSVTVVQASLDEVVSNEGVDAVFQGAKMEHIEADHDFTGEARKVLIDLCEKEIVG